MSIYPKKSKEEFEKIFNEMYGKTLGLDDGQEFVMWTGKGGVKDYLKIWIEDSFKEPYTWRSMRKAYCFLVKVGGIEKCGKLYRIS